MQHPVVSSSSTTNLLPTNGTYVIVQIDPLRTFRHYQVDVSLRDATTRFDQYLAHLSNVNEDSRACTIHLVSKISSNSVDNLPSILLISSTVPSRLSSLPTSDNSSMQSFTLYNKSDNSIPSSIFRDTCQHLDSPIWIFIGDFHPSADNIEITLTPNDLERASRITQKSARRGGGSLRGSTRASSSSNSSDSYRPTIIPTCTLWTDLRILSEVRSSELFMNELRELSHIIREPNPTSQTSDYLLSPSVRRSSYRDPTANAHTLRWAWEKPQKYPLPHNQPIHNREKEFSTGSIDSLARIISPQGNIIPTPPPAPLAGYDKLPIQPIRPPIFVPEDVSCTSIFCDSDNVRRLLGGRKIDAENDKGEEKRAPKTSIETSQEEQWRQYLDVPATTSTVYKRLMNSGTVSQRGEFNMKDR
ncbi:hypothetical protein SISNIDRAFT_488216 [Sistotremastrum niveocremeum HHB9708]|uniref:Uncharacterized protein n=1 Tax=Sistotremastrum niveocremeum HHB9708 TaxID=1314777 RepID=A0A164RKI6_9AGAM|nr:hypothetical protein SISNIDRAFT_488216 [Sistotremastrum niveocremeum HHB9708]